MSQTRYGATICRHEWCYLYPEQRKGYRKRIKDIEKLFNEKNSVHDVLKGLRKLNKVRPMTWRDLYEKYDNREFKTFRGLQDGMVFEAPLEDAKKKPYLDYVISRNDEEIVYTIELGFPKSSSLK